MKSILVENRDWINETWKKIDNKLQKVAVRSKNKMPYTAIDGVHDDKTLSDPNWWTNGFWPGMMWLMYVDTKNELYKSVAENAEKLLDGAFKKYDEINHDTGFMWDISSGVNYRLTGNNESKTRFMLAASILFSRFNLKGNYIRAWNTWEGVEETHIGWSIIDCMMNLPLLYRASEETKDPRFTYIAEKHAEMAMRDHVRPDGSVVHIVSHNPLNGDVIETFGGQGYAVGSSWSRGQAWALYGFILNYIHTGKEAYLDTAKRVAHYFIANIYDDFLPKCDFRSPDEPVIYDTTAGACAACGLIEIANNVPELEKNIYLNAAIKMLKAMEEKFCDWNVDNDFILQGGTEAYNNGHHMPIIYGDYYFIEALYKLRGNEMLFW